MATVYSGYSGKWRPQGSSVDKHYRARLDYWVSAETDTTITYAAAVYVNINSSVNSDYTGGLNLGGTEYSGGCSTVFGKDTTVLCINTKTKTFNKGVTPTTAYIGASMRSNHSKGSWGGTVSVGVNVGIPAIRYDISYNANGGENPPAAQKKTHDVALVLQTLIPTRTDYDFVEWNTAADGSGTSFAPGDTFEINAITVLYAIWHESFKPPVVENLRAYRVANGQSGYNPNVRSDGTKCYADFDLTNPISGTISQIMFTFGGVDVTVVGTEVTTKYAYSPDNHLPATSKENVIVTLSGSDYLGNPFSYTFATYISTENYVWDAFKGSQNSEEYESFAVGGIARDFSNSNRSSKGNFDIYMDVSIVLNNGVQIVDSGTTITVIKTGSEETDDYLLAKAIADTFDYQTAKEILEV